jgi:hypothetical protein
MAFTPNIERNIFDGVRGERGGSTPLTPSLFLKIRVLKLKPKVKLR